ncbi:MAG: DUF1460 domain-containing protein [Alphaproteobacteria bacterium]|nr:DUF1460 domain-containing protein [Alphaproteobacteria bacterium]
MKAISEPWLGLPYQLGPLGEAGGVDPDPVMRFDVFDCLTFIEEVLASPSRRTRSARATCAWACATGTAAPSPTRTAATSCSPSGSPGPSPRAGRGTSPRSSPARCRRTRDIRWRRGRVGAAPRALRPA